MDNIAQEELSQEEAPKKEEWQDGEFKITHWRYRPRANREFNQFKRTYFRKRGFWNFWGSLGRVYRIDDSYNKYTHFTSYIPFLGLRFGERIGKLELGFTDLVDLHEKSGILINRTFNCSYTE
jgi:hypothetical protein